MATSKRSKERQGLGIAVVVGLAFVKFSVSDDLSRSCFAWTTMAWPVSFLIVSRV